MNSYEDYMFRELLSSQQAVLGEHSIHAIIKMTEYQQHASTIQAPPTERSFHARTQAIKKCLERGAEINVDLLNVLLGPRLSEARAQAAQHFFNPEIMLMYHVYWILLSTAQLTFSSSAESGMEFVDQFHEDKKKMLRLKILLDQLVASYSEAFSYLKSTAQSFINDLFIENKLRYPLLQSVSLVFDVIQKKSPAYAKDFFLAPTGEQDPECRAYTRANIEQKAIALEKERYSTAALQFLMSASEETINDVLEALELESLKPSEQVSHQLIIKKTRAQEIVDLFTSLPNARDYDTEEWLLHPAVRLSPIADLFFSRGAPMLSQTNKEWDLLAHSLNYVIPKNFQDEFFRQRVQEYCRSQPRVWFGIIHTTHSTERFRFICKGVKESSRSVLSFLDATKYITQRMLKIYEKKSLLWRIILDSELIVPQLISAFLEDLIERFTYFLYTVPREVPTDTAIFSDDLSIVDFTDYQFSPVTARQHAYSLKRKINFQILKLNNQSFQAYKAERIPRYRDVFDYFLRALPFYTQLVILEISNSEINDEFFVQLMRKIASLKNLSGVFLNTNLITDIGILQFHQFVMRRIFHSFPGLTELDLSGNFMTQKSVDVLTKMIPRFVSLEKLTIKEGIVIFPYDAIVNSLNYRSESNYCSPRSESLYSSDSSLSSRNSLDIYRGQSIDGYEPFMPFYSIKEKAYNNLYCAIPMAIITKKNEKYWSSYIDSGVLRFPDRSGRIDHLIQFLVGVSDDALVGVDFRNKMMHLSQLKSLLTALVHLTSLKHLQLSDIMIINSDESLTKIELIVEVLPKLSTLEYLELTDSGLTEAEVKALLGAINKNVSIHTVLLADFIMKQFHDEIEAILGERQLKAAYSEQSKVAYAPVQYPNIKYRTIKEKKYLLDFPEQYYFIRMEIDEISLQWNAQQSFHDCVDALAQDLTDQRRHPNRYLYYSALHTELYAILKARSLLSTGLFTQAEQGNLGMYAGMGLSVVEAAIPITIPVSLVVMELVRQIDASERQTFNSKISYLFRRHRQEHIQPLAKIFALLFLLKYIDNCQEYRLSSHQWKSDAAKIVQFLGDHNSLSDPVTFEMYKDYTIVLRRIIDLMTLCFDETHCVIPMTWKDWLQCRDSLNLGVMIYDTKKIEEKSPMPATFIRPCGHRLFIDVHLSSSLREQEKTLRSALIYVATRYKSQWGESGFYQNLLNRHIKCHGGEETIQLCADLIRMAKTLPYYELIRALKDFLKNIESASGWRKESLQTLLVQLLASAGTELSERIEINSTFGWFFGNKSRIKSIKEQLLESYEFYT